MKHIRIISGDGLAGVTQITDAETGEEIGGISKIELELSAESGGYWQAKLTTVYPVSIDITAEVVETCECGDKVCPDCGGCECNCEENDNE